MAKGKHTRAGYVELIFALHRGQHSGRLRITHGRRYRELLFLAGRPVIYRSDLPEEDLAHTLVYADLIPQDRIKWIADKLSPDEKLEDALVMSGSVSKEQIEEHIRSRTRPGISGPLTWSSGSWSFDALSDQVTEGIDPRLLPDESALPALWNGVSQHVGTDEVLPAVTDAKKGQLTMQEGAADVLDSLGFRGIFEAGRGDWGGSQCGGRVSHDPRQYRRTLQADLDVGKRRRVASGKWLPELFDCRCVGTGCQWCR